MKLTGKIVGIRFRILSVSNDPVTFVAPLKQLSCFVPVSLSQLKDIA